MATVSIVIGVIFSIVLIFFSTRNAARARQGKIFMKFHEYVSEKEFLDGFQKVVSIWHWQSAEEFLEKYGPNENRSL